MAEPARTLPPETPRRPAAPARPQVVRILEWLLRPFLLRVRIDPEAVRRIRNLAARGTLIYTMRYRSWVDYLLVTHVLRREGLPIPAYASELRSSRKRPLRERVAALWQRLRGGAAAALEMRAAEEREHCRRLVHAGQPVLIFMRGPVPGLRTFTSRQRAVSGIRTGSDYLREIVHHFWSAPDDIFIVPIALLRGRGLRSKEARDTTLVYSAQDVPGEIRRLASFLWNSRETVIHVGAEISLREFLQAYRREGEERAVRRLARAIQIFLYREERMVWGPPLLPKRMVLERVLESDHLRQTIRQLAAKEGQSEAELRRRAERYLREMAANFNGLYFAILEFAFNRIWPRVFQGLECYGLERVIEKVKQHPVVLVPCHRSHFDYLVLSYLFHLNYLSPPHIAAGINLSFWPLGPLFRGAGAFFIRRTFEGDELYKAVFREYLTFLIREGYTLEFFIEGGRSRTGKILTPRLGMLSAIVDAFIRGVRRDLYLVPISIHYGRVVEEESYERELSGAEKQRESLSALVRARRVLGRRHGMVTITFAEPISLNQALGPDKERFRARTGEEIENEKRRFIRKLGFRLLREVNAVAVAGATSVAATVLLGNTTPACRYSVFAERALALVALLRRLGVRFTASLERNAEAGFRENLAFLESGGLVELRSLDGEVIIYAPTEKRLRLDFYKNNTIHFFLLPALVVDALSRRVADVRADVIFWLDLFRWEFPLPEREELEGEIERLRAYFRETGALVEEGGVERLAAHPLVATLSGTLDDFREAYRVAAQTLMGIDPSGLPRKECVRRMQDRFAIALLLGEVRHPEACSAVTFGNAISRYAEMALIEVRGGRGGDQIVVPGPRHGELAQVAERIGEGLAAAQVGDLVSRAGAAARSC